MIAEFSIVVYGPAHDEVYSTFGMVPMWYPWTAAGSVAKSCPWYGTISPDPCQNHEQWGVWGTNYR